MTAGSAPCPCGSGRALAACCGRWHAGEPAPTAEALMRSRYSAFALGLSEYLLATWHADTRPPSLALDRHLKWLGLEVRSQHESGARAIVEFVARSKPAAGPAIRLHETSRFVREGGRWYYIDAGPGR